MISETLLPCVSSDPSATFPVFGKEDAITRNPVDLHAIVHQAVAQCQSQAMASEVSLHIYSKELHSNIMGDEEKMEQVIAGIIQCCLGMTCSGDTIKVKLLHSKRKALAVARLIIKDNGHGLTPEALECIFDVKDEASDHISLASIERLVILQDGGICIRSLPGVGTRFALDFPILSD